MSAIKKITMKYDRSTPGTHLYREVDDKGERTEEICPSVYFRKAAFPGKPPMTITLTVEF